MHTHTSQTEVRADGLLITRNTSQQKALIFAECGGAKKLDSNAFAEEDSFDVGGQVATLITIAAVVVVTCRRQTFQQTPAKRAAGSGRCTSVLMSRAAHDDFAFAAGSQLERLVTVAGPRVCRARVGVDGASRTILEKLREVGGRRGGSSETHGCINEIQAKVCRSPFGIACADLPHASGAL